MFKIALVVLKEPTRRAIFAFILVNVMANNTLTSLCMLLQACLADQLTVTLVAHKWLNNFTAVVGVFIDIFFGLEGSFTFWTIFDFMHVLHVFFKRFVPSEGNRTCITPMFIL